MTVFGYRIERRFWFILGGLILILIVFLVLAGRNSNPAEKYLTNPAFPTKYLPEKAADPQWLEPYTEYAINTPSTVDPFFQLTSYSGTPFKSLVYIPERQEAQALRPDLVFSQNGWDFIPGVFLPPDQPISTEGLAEKGAELEDGRPLLLGFPAGKFRATGGAQAQEITGLLYGHNKMLKTSDQATVAPIVLVSSARPVNAEELNFPATERADLGITYLQGPRMLELRSVEWSSGKRIRLCLKITNIGDRPLPTWSGKDNIQGLYTSGSGQQISQQAIVDEQSSLVTSFNLAARGSAEGYVWFETPPLAGPDETLQLTVPDLGDIDSAKRSTTLRVEPRQFKPVADLDRAAGGRPTGGCLSAS